MPSANGATRDGARSSMIYFVAANEAPLVERAVARGAHPTFHTGTPAANDATRNAHARR